MPLIDMHVPAKRITAAMSGPSAETCARTPATRRLPALLRAAPRAALWGGLLALLLAGLVKVIRPLPAARQFPGLDNSRLQALAQATTLLAAPAPGAFQPIRFDPVQPGFLPTAPASATATAAGNPQQPAAGPVAPLPPMPAPAPAASSRTRIPDTIEGDWSPPTHADALADLTINARLKVLDGSNGPLRLLAVHLHDGAPRAQLQRRAASGAIEADPGWFEVGASPLAGWRLLEVLPLDALLLTPQGIPMRIHLEAPAASGGASGPPAPHVP